MVAKSYQKNKILCEPYVENGKMYVKIETQPKSGIYGEKQVRWYTDTEYARMYPNDKPVVNNSDRKSQKELFGFDKGYITILRGDTYEEKDFYKASNFRYHRVWGWYLPSFYELPENMPDTATPVKLFWEMVGGVDGELKDESMVKEAVESILYESDEGVYVGQVGERLDLYVEIEKIVEISSYYGQSKMYIMKSEDGNHFNWTTSSIKPWEVGDCYHIRGTIKKQDLYRNQKINYLSRCSVVD